MQTASNYAEPVLVLFFKRPQIGVGKQRLAATIGAEKAFQLANAMLECAFEDMANWSGALVFAVASDGDKYWAEEIISSKFNSRQCMVFSQGSGNMGERLNRIDQKIRDLGFQNLFYIGSDAPVLNSDIYSHARTVLTKHNALLARSDDGGVTIMASNRLWPPLSELPWSAATLGDALATHCQQEGWSVGEIDGLYDVDTIDELIRLSADLENDSRPARTDLRSKVNQVLADNHILVA